MMPIWPWQLAKLKMVDGIVLVRTRIITEQWMWEYSNLTQSMKRRGISILAAKISESPNEYMIGRAGLRGLSIKQVRIRNT